MKSTHEKFELLITQEARERILNYVALAPGEISGLGLVTKSVVRGTTQFLVDEVFLLKQECASASTELDDDAVIALMLELEKRGVDGARLRFWWHSHATMNTFWSQTDADTIKKLCNSSYLVSLVVNKAQNMLFRVDAFEPFRMTVDEVDARVQFPNLNLYDECKKEYEEKVTERRAWGHTPAGYWKNGVFVPTPAYGHDDDDMFTPGYFCHGGAPAGDVKPLPAKKVGKGGNGKKPAGFRPEKEKTVEQKATGPEGIIIQYAGKRMTLAEYDKLVADQLKEKEEEVKDDKVKRALSDEICQEIQFALEHWDVSEIEHTKLLQAAIDFDGGLISFEQLEAVYSEVTGFALDSL